jgi:hypothetical protein
VSDHPAQTNGPVPRPSRPSGDAAERLGEQVGRLAVRAMRHLEQLVAAGVATAGQVRADPDGATEPGPTEPGPTGPGATEPGQPAPGSTTARAEALVDGVGDRLGALATAASHHLRKAAALAREEAEDLWAEAQQIRAAQRRDPE